MKDKKSRFLQAYAINRGIFLVYKKKEKKKPGSAGIHL